MHEIAVTASVAVIFFKLPARCFAKIRNGGKINNNWSAGIKPTLHGLQSGGRLFFLPELDVNISNHVICKVITNIQVFNLTELAKLLENVFKEILEMLLYFARIHGLALRI